MKKEIDDSSNAIGRSRRRSVHRLKQRKWRLSRRQQTFIITRRKPCSFSSTPIIPPGHSLARVVSVQPISSSRIAGCPAGGRRAAIGRRGLPCFPKSSPLSRAFPQTQPSGTHKLASVCPPTMSMHKALFHGHGTNTSGSSVSATLIHALTHTRLPARSLPSSSIIECHGQRWHFPQKAHARTQPPNAHRVRPCRHATRRFRASPPWRVLSSTKDLHHLSLPSSFRHRRRRLLRRGELIRSLARSILVARTSSGQRTGNTVMTKWNNLLCTWNVLRDILYTWRIDIFRDDSSKTRDRQRKNGNDGYRAA